MFSQKSSNNASSRIADFKSPNQRGGLPDITASVTSKLEPTNDRHFDWGFDTVAAYNFFSNRPRAISVIESMPKGKHVDEVEHAFVYSVQKKKDDSQYTNVKEMLERGYDCDDTLLEPTATIGTRTASVVDQEESLYEGEKVLIIAHEDRPWAPKSEGPFTQFVIERDGPWDVSISPNSDRLIVTPKSPLQLPCPLNSEHINTLCQLVVERSSGSWGPQPISVPELYTENKDNEGTKVKQGTLCYIWDNECRGCNSTLAPEDCRFD